MLKTNLLCNVPKYLHEQSLQELVSLLNKCSVCPDNYDEDYFLHALSFFFVLFFVNAIHNCLNE